MFWHDILTTHSRMRADICSWFAYNCKASLGIGGAFEISILIINPYMIEQRSSAVKWGHVGAYVQTFSDGVGNQKYPAA